jgi:hypothetical protein
MIFKNCAQSLRKKMIFPKWYVFPVPYNHPTPKPQKNRTRPKPYNKKIALNQSWKKRKKGKSPSRESRNHRRKRRKETSKAENVGLQKRRMSMHLNLKVDG